MFFLLACAYIHIIIIESDVSKNVDCCHELLWQSEQCAYSSLCKSRTAVSFSLSPLADLVLSFRDLLGKRTCVQIIIPESMKSVSVDDKQTPSSMQPSNWHNWHQPSLWHPSEQPNANIIYHLQSDGKITFQKGGWAYGARTEFCDEPAICHNRDVTGVDVSKFDLKFNHHSGREIHYIIVERDVARKLRQQGVDVEMNQ